MVRVIVLTSFSTIFQLYRVGQFNGGWNRGTRRKPPTCRKSLTNFITLCCIEYTSPWSGRRIRLLRGNIFSNQTVQIMIIPYPIPFANLEGYYNSHLTSHRYHRCLWTGHSIPPFFILFFCFFSFPWLRNM
jgi:hypothetical protein